jgi:hypothetical protein
MRRVKMNPFKPPALALLVLLTACDSGPQRIILQRDAPLTAAADLDGDGDLDVAKFRLSMGTKDVEQVELFLNDGAGELRPIEAIDIEGRIAALNLADIDGDGDADVVATLFIDQRLTRGEVPVSAIEFRFFANDGAARFSERGSISVVDEAIGAIADFDGDGDQDLLTAKSPFDASDSVALRRNDGAGAFAEPEALFPLDAEGTSLRVGDLDADGDLDAVISCGEGFVNPSGFTGLVTLKNDGAGRFDERIAAPDLPELQGAIELADIDADGALDVVMASSAPAVHLRLFRGDGAGRFGAAEFLLDDKSPRSLAVGDIEGDGDLDIAFIRGGFDDTEVAVLENDGAGGFTDRDVPGGPATVTVELGDADLDGTLDLLKTEASGDLVVRLFPFYSSRE